MFFKVEPLWRILAKNKCRASKEEFLTVLTGYRKRTRIRTYSLLGTRGDADFMVWSTCDSLETLQEFHSDILRTHLGKHVSTPYSYLAMSRPSEYFGSPPDPEPVGSKYLFVYPFTKKREWYSLPFEERREMMKEHVRVGQRFPSVTIHTGYSFGLDDYEFVLSFETDQAADFSNLVMELRSSQASRYTAVETPIFTCLAVDPQKMLGLLGP